MSDSLEVQANERWTKVAVRRGQQQAVTARTAKRRARKVQADLEAKANAHSGPAEPETVTQAKVWDRKRKRYLIAGLCNVCAAQAAWGHALGFGKDRIKEPCNACQPIVDGLPDAGPRGSKWRKCLLKLEYLSDAEVQELFA